MTREELLAMEGRGWEGDLDAMRAGDPIVELPADLPGLREADES
jgi:hypothetical protein